MKSETDPDLSSWYRHNSLVYVAANHACWSDEELAKKVSKRRFGGVRRSPYAGLARMMDEHADEVRTFVLERLTPDEEEDEDGRLEKGAPDADEPPPKGSLAPAVGAAGTLGVRSGDTTEEDK